MPTLEYEHKNPSFGVLELTEPADQFQEKFSLESAKIYLQKTEEKLAEHDI